MNALITKLKKNEDLLDSEMGQAIESIMAGGCATSEVEAFLTFLRDKGETSSEIASAAKVMRRHCDKLPHNYPDLLDTCGTGGDAKNTVNVSTVAAIVACAAGVQVAKHGNRSVSSVCGSADLLEMLGVRIDLAPTQVAECLERTGFAFMFAPIFHPSVKHAMAARKNVGGKTIFNLLGPLTNPAGAQYQLLGVYSDRVLMPVASALIALGLKRAMVVHGSDGMDEITTCGSTRIVIVDEGKIHERKIDPGMFRIKTARHEDLVCVDKAQNLTSAQGLLEGQMGPFFDIVCLNAGAALWVCGKTTTIEKGVDTAREILASGLALEKLQEIAQVSQEVRA